jgi:SAM-dependent methyltransferase
MARPAWPRRLSRRLVDGVVRLLLGPQVQVPAAARSHDPARLAARTDELNAAAERYFVDYPGREYLLAKPYSDPQYFAQYLFNLGVLFHRLRVGPGDVVLELGAGSCWVSHFLNLYGCRTVAVDVSPTALALGRELFERDRRTRWDLEPRFLSYDGHRLPLGDGSCDRIVLHDAFHHLPNPGEIVAEMHRVLRDGGLVAMEEPGRTHSLSETSVKEAATGVLENDVVIEDLAALARGCGFARVTVVPLSLADTPEVPAERLTALLRGAGFSDYWLALCRGAVASHFILMYKGEFRPTARQPGRLAARIEPLGPAAGGSLRVAAGEPARLRCRLTNLGDTRWLADTGGRPGWTLLGARLREAEGEALRDWARTPLDRDLDPGDRTVLDVALPPLDRPGRHRVVLDLVAEHIAWFADRGSAAVELELIVEPDGARPGPAAAG